MTDKICIRCYIKKDTPYLALTGELWGVFCEDFGENWPRYNGTALYVGHDPVIYSSHALGRMHAMWNQELCWDLYSSILP